MNVINLSQNRVPDPSVCPNICRLLWFYLFSTRLCQSKFLLSGNCSRLPVAHATLLHHYWLCFQLSWSCTTNAPMHQYYTNLLSVSVFKLVAHAPKLHQYCTNLYQCSRSQGCLCHGQFLQWGGRSAGVLAGLTRPDTSSDSVFRSVWMLLASWNSKTRRKNVYLLFMSLHEPHKAIYFHRFS